MKENFFCLPITSCQPSSILIFEGIDEDSCCLFFDKRFSWWSSIWRVIVFIFFFLLFVDCLDVHWGEEGFCILSVLTILRRRSSSLFCTFSFDDKSSSTELIVHFKIFFGYSSNGWTIAVWPPLAASIKQFDRS